MDFMKLAKERFSVRKFMDKPVEQEKLGYAAEGATPAPLHDASHDLKEMVQYL